MTSDMSNSARVIVDVSHSPLAFIYGCFKPTVTINGERSRRCWGTHSFELPAGSYEIAVSYPWLFAPECGKNSVKFDLARGEEKQVVYRAGLVRYRPGKMEVR